MRIFVMDKYTGLCLCLLCALLLAVPVLWYQSEPVSASVAACPVSVAETDTPVYSVTFNISGDGSTLPVLLATLEAIHCDAVFFAATDWAKSHPELLHKIAASGHTVGGFIEASRDADEKALLSLIEQTDQALTDIIGISPVFFRCAEAAPDSVFASVCYQSGRIPIGKATDSLDWRNFSAEQVSFRLCDRMQNGAILQFQTDTLATSSFDTILSALASIGYAPVSLKTLFPPNDAKVFLE